MAGDYADDAVDQALNGNYWFPDDEYEGDDADFAPYRPWWMRPFRPRRRKPTNQEIFANFVDKPIDYSQF